MNNQDNLSLEKYIREVNYGKYEHGYVPSTFAMKFINFIKLVNGGEGEENKSPLFHYDMLDGIASHPNNLIVSFRGSAKSSLIGEYLLLYIATYGELDNFGSVDVAMYIGDTADNGCKNLRNNIQFRYEKSQFLKTYLPDVRFTDTKIEFTNAEGKRLAVRLFGANVGVRGFKEYGKRPTLAILDDLFTDKAAESDTIIKDIENVVYKAVRQALHPTHRKVIWIGTPFNKKDPLYKAAGTKEWNTKVFPICEKFPCTKEEFKGAWVDRFPYEAVMDEYLLLKGQGKMDAFNQELMLRIMSTDDRLVQDEDILWYKRNLVLDSKNRYNFYITTDFATSDTQSSDFSVISVWALGSDGVFRWVDGIVKRQDMAKNVDDLFRLVKMYPPLFVGVEISGQQKGFVAWIKREMALRNTYFSLAKDKVGREEGLRPTTNKLTRFNIVLPLFKQRKIAFPEELANSPTLLEFIDELTSVTPTGFKSLHDDCADTVSMIAMLDYFKPAETQGTVEDRDEEQPMKGKYFSWESSHEGEIDSYFC